MNRFKLILVLVIVALTGVLWFQNQQLLALQFFCPDLASENSCLYRTPELTLVTWMIVFAVAGAVSNILSQVLARAGSSSKISSTSRISNPNSKNSKPSQEEKQFTRVTQANTLPSPEAKSKSLSDWDQENSKDWENTHNKNSPQATTERPKLNKLNNPRKEKIDTDSGYSSQKTNIGSRKSGRTQTEAGGGRSDEVEDVYDATYRTVGSPQSPQSEGKDDEQWI